MSSGTLSGNHGPSRAEASLTYWLRRLRPYHRWIGLAASLGIILSSATGITLAFKKEAAILQPPVRLGVAYDFSEWREVGDIAFAAQAALARVLAVDQQSLHIDRLDIRTKESIVKVLFAEGYWEVQIDPVTLDTLSIARRHSDWIEELHDFSFLGRFGKILALGALGLGLGVLTISGATLYLGPIWLRRRRAARSNPVSGTA